MQVVINLMIKYITNNKYASINLYTQKMKDIDLYIFT